MRLPIATRYALRSLLRHRRRSLLSVVAIGVGCAVCLFMVSFVRGEGEMMMRAAAESGTGHLRIVPPGWLETRDPALRLADWEALLRTARDHPGVAVAAPRATVDALLAMGTRTAGVTLTGVDPAAEPALNRLVRQVEQGAWLAPDSAGEVVIGRGLAERLDVGLGDALLVTASGRGGELGSAMLRVRGVLATGSRNLDDTLCQVLLADLEEISGYPGAAGIALLLADPDTLDATAAALGAALPAGPELVTWDQIVPELAAGVEVDETWTRLMVGVVVIVVFLGIASAQLAAVLERRREFAVLAAIGMKGRRLVGVMLAEGVLLGVVGSGLALGLGVPLTYWLASHGIDFSKLYGQSDFTVSNILVDPVLYGDFGWWLVPLAGGLSLAATLLSSLYPAWYALTVDPAEALRVEQ